MGAPGTRTRRYLGHHILHPQILRLLKVGALFIWPAKDGGATFVECRKFSPPCSFYCTEDAGSNYENLQKNLKTRLFWAYFDPFVLNKSSYT